ncbi:MAG: gliding motility-associated C-terminal domain-containing protein [Flavobacteriales bacterium]|nr:gliding motility-associated C-terminal domain-containing protein [Flavobacteriales bacterium]
MISFLCFGLVLATNADSAKENQFYNQKLNSLLVGQNQLFMGNSGQWDDGVLFQTNGNGASASFYQDKVLFSLRKELNTTYSSENPFELKGSFLNWALIFDGSNTSEITPSDLQQNNKNFIGSKNNGSVKLSEYGQLLYSNIYKNTDLKFYSSKNGELKYDFIIKPGACLEEIKMRYDGIRNLKISESGELILDTDWGFFKEDKPYSYQIIDGQKIEVNVRYAVNNNTCGFEIIGNYNPEYELIIDPIYVDWSTYFYGETIGSFWGYNYILDVDIDDENFVYVTGMSWNQKFESRLGGWDTTTSGNSYRAFIAKITADGDSLEYFTFIGQGYSMNLSVSSTHEAVISGIAWGAGFPTTSGAYDEGGRTCSGCWQGFVTKLSDKGDSLIYSTYLSGRTSSSTWDWIRGMQVTPNGKVYLVGNTTSQDFPVTAGCYQSTYGGDATTTGYYYYERGDGFLTCLSADGSSLVFSTYIGGDGNDVAKDVFVADGGEIYVVGSSSSGNFKTTPGAPVFNTYIKGERDGFFIKFKPSGNSVEYSKLMGGTGDESFEGIFANAGGEPYLVGNSNSSNFPVSKNAYQKKNAGGYDIVVVKLISAGTNFRYSTYLGGSGDDGHSPYSYWFESASITANVKEEAIIAATSKSTNFPLTSDALQTSNISTFSYTGKLTISKLSYDATELKYGTFFGGNGGEFPGGIRAKKVGCVSFILFGGVSYQGGYPTTAGSYRDSLPTSGNYWNGFVTKFRDTLYTEPIALGLQDSIVECDKVFEIFDAQNQGADFLWSDGTTKRYNIVEDSGTFWVRATYGCDTVHDTIHIALEHSPKVPIFDNDTTYCDVFPTLLLNAKNDTIYRTYKWQNGAKTQTIWVNTPGKYYVDVMTPHCGTKTDTLNLKFLKSANLSFPTETHACDSINLILDAENENVEMVYRWNTGDSTQTISVTDTGFYKVVLSNYCGIDSSFTTVKLYTTPTVSLPNDSVFCDSIKNFVLKAGNKQNLETTRWTDIGETLLYSDSDSFIPSAPDFYLVMVENSCGVAKDSIKLSTIFTPNQGKLDTIYACDKVAQTLNLPNTKANNQEKYSWLGGVSNSSILNVNKEGLYVGYIQNKCGIDSSSWNIILKKTPTVKLPTDETFCDKMKVDLNVKDADDEMKYEWQDGTTTPTFTATKAGTYRVVLSNRCGTASDEVIYKLLQTPAVDLGDDMVFCGSSKLKPITYSVGLPNNEEKYLWSSGGTAKAEQISAEGNHWVQISNYCGTASDTINFRVSVVPVVNLGSDTILCGNFALTLDAGNPGLEYLWMPYGETTQKIVAKDQITYSVIVTNADGCEAGDDYFISDKCVSFYHIPTSFSPNNDGLNDEFKPTLVNFEKYSLSIYNRWGEELFATEDANTAWNGSYNDKPVPPGVYMYTMRFITTENGKFISVNGLIHVVR